ncbi:hypothetical protein BGX26_000780, partial [Mortierella sp. AD094]
MLPLSPKSLQELSLKGNLAQVLYATADDFILHPVRKAMGMDGPPSQTGLAQSPNAVAKSTNVVAQVPEWFLPSSP